MALTRAQANRKIRQDQLREFLSAQQHELEALKALNQLKDLDSELDSTQVQRLSKVFDGHFKILGKYLPDLKATELTGEAGEELNQTISVSFVDSDTEGV